MRAAIEDFLSDAKSLIKDTENWTTKHYAKNRRGVRVNTVDKNASQFCAIGALIRTSHNRKIESNNLVRIKAEIYLYRANALLKFGAGVTTTNDGLNGHARVMKVYDKAIEMVRNDKSL